MIIQILMGMAVLLLPSRDPERFHRAGFRLGTVQRWIWSGGTILTSLLFLGVGLLEDTRNVVSFLVMIAAGAAVTPGVVRSAEAGVRGEFDAFSNGTRDDFQTILDLVTAAA